MRGFALFIAFIISAVSAFAQMLAPIVFDRTSQQNYTGPGDIVSGAWGWYGLRAYNAAYATGSNKGVKLYRTSDTTQQDINILSTGAVDSSSASTFCNATTCYASVWYDQSGNGRDLSWDGNPADGDTIVFTGCTSGSLPCLVNGGAGRLGAVVNPNFAQPVSYQAVAIRTGNTGTVQTIISTIDNATGCGVATFMGFSTANLVRNGSGPNITAAATDSVWHILSGTINGASTSLTVDGSRTTGAGGSNGAQIDLTVGYWACIGSPLYMTGKFTEAGIWNASFTSQNETDLYNNAKTYWGL